jgi:glycosyltransferase involved in cell wall biosynthesis
VPLRIAHFIQRYPPALGGSEAYFARLSRWLACRGEEVTVFTTTAKALASMWSAKETSLGAGREIVDGVEVRRYQPHWRFRGRRWLLRPLGIVPHRNWQGACLSCNPFVWDLWRECGHPRRPFDIVHATAFPYVFPILCGQRLARRLRIPFCLTPFLHLGDPDNPRDPIRRAYTTPAMMSLARAADVVFAQTPTERSALILGGVDPEKVLLQGLAVDVADCTGGSRERARRAWGIGPAEIVVGHLSNNSGEKGTVDLLLAASLLWQRGLSFRLALAGPAMPNFERFWREQDFGSEVIRLGPLTELEKRDFFASIDLFALPSRSDSFGLVFLEAWANKCPNLAYRAGGVADVLWHERDSLVVPCGDVLALAEGLRRLVMEPALRRRLGETGHHRVEQEFCWEDKLSVVEQAYARLCAKRHRPMRVPSITADHPLFRDPSPARAERRSFPVAPR